MYRSTADLFNVLGNSCFGYNEWATDLLVWSKPNQSNRRSAVQWYFRIQSKVLSLSKLQRWIYSGNAICILSCIKLSTFKHLTLKHEAHIHEKCNNLNAPGQGIANLHHASYIIKELTEKWILIQLNLIPRISKRRILVKSLLITLTKL